MERGTCVDAKLILNRTLRDGRRLPGTTKKFRDSIDHFPWRRFLTFKQANHAGIRRWLDQRIVQDKKLVFGFQQEFIQLRLDWLDLRRLERRHGRRDIRARPAHDPYSA